MKSLFANVYALFRVPYFPLADSLRVYRKYGISKAVSWFLLRLLVPFGLSQSRNTRDGGIVGRLRSLGYAELPPRAHDEVAELIAFFLQQQSIADSQVYRTLNEYFAHWRGLSVLRPAGLKANGQPDCPLTRLSRDPGITKLACRFMGVPIQKILAQATIDALIRVEGTPIQIDGYDGAIEFHRDIDSWKWIKVFVYLTNTNEGDGHHEMFPSSHLRTPISLVPIRRYKQSEILSAMPELKLAKICGPAGFTFIENTFAFHRGTEPSKNDRLILTITYYDESVSKWMYADDSFSLD
jgi:hypothetical protein